MILDGWLKLGHVLGAMVWLGGGLMLSVMGARARASNDPAAIRQFARALAWVGPRVLLPAVVAVLVFGVWLVLSSAAWDFAQPWIIIAIALFALTFVIGAGYLGRIAIRLERAVDTAADTDSRRLLDRWLLGYGVVLIVLVVIVADMVLKPGV
jgi:uncharacterized membrane protein